MATILNPEDPATTSADEAQDSAPLSPVGSNVPTSLSNSFPNNTPKPGSCPCGNLGHFMIACPYRMTCSSPSIQTPTQNGTPGKDSPSTSPTSMSQTSSDNPFDIEDALGMQNLALGLDEPETRVNVTKAMEDYEKIKNDARKTMDGNKKTTKGGEPARPPPTPPTTDDDDDASNDNEEAPNDDGGIWDEDKEAVDHHVETALTVTPKIRTRSPLFSSRKRAHKRSRKT